MDQQIEQRINQLNSEVIPNGYKQTDFGVFPCEWVTNKTFGDLFDFYGGLSKSRDELGDEGHAYLHYGDLHKGDFNIASIEAYKKLPKLDISLKGSETYLMEDGDVAFLDASEDLEGTSRAVLVDNPDNEPFIAGLHIIYGKSKDISLEKWFKQYITSSSSVRKQFQRLAVGFKVYGVNRDTLPRIKVAYPASLEEQVKIAKILMKWDEAIALYEKQIELLKKQKKVFLSELFPRKGEDVPRHRFPGFSAPWEQRKLGDLGTFKNGMNFSKDAMDKGYPFINLQNIFGRNVIDTDNLGLAEATDTQLREYNLLQGDILFVRSSVKLEGVGEAALVPKSLENTTYSGFIIRFRDESNMDDDFKRFVFGIKSVRDQIMAKATNSANKNISQEVLNNLEFLLPSNAEQQKIGSFFSRLDTLITLHQRKCDKIKYQRQVLQQYLLTGIVRV